MIDTLVCLITLGPEHCPPRIGWRAWLFDHWWRWRAAQEAREQWRVATGRYQVRLEGTMRDKTGRSYHMVVRG